MVGTKFKGYSKVTMRIKKDLTSSKTDDARSSFFVLAWDFRGCRTLPFSRGQKMPNFPKNRNLHILLHRGSVSQGDVVVAALHDGDGGYQGQLGFPLQVGDVGNANVAHGGLDLVRSLYYSEIALATEDLHVVGT